MRLHRRELPTSLRICFVSQRFPLRGYHTDYGYMWPLLKSVVQAGHSVTVVTTEDLRIKPGESISGVTIHTLDKNLLRSMGVSIDEAIVELIQELQAEKKFHIIHCADETAHLVAKNRHLLTGGLAVDVRATSLDLLFGVVGLTQERVSSYIRSAFQISWRFLRTYWKKDRWLLHRADGIFAVSEQQRILLERYYFVPAHHVHVIPLGVEAPELISASKDMGLARELGIPENSQIVVTVSELDEVGALKNLITAFERVAVKKQNAVLIIVGDGPRFFDVEGHALSYALGNRVFFARHVPHDQIKDYVNLADVYVNLDSRSSGLEPSVLQAMVNRKMVIASEVGSNATVIENGIDGYLIHPTVTEDIAFLIMDAFSGQLDVTTIGNNAHQKILKMFDSRRMVEKTILAYQEILLNARTPIS